MADNVILLLVSLVVILAGCELFVNGVEWFGRHLELGEGAVGSVLAAVGTALPETLIPIIAIFFGTGESGHEIGIGAILGAPFMLVTLAMFVNGVAIVIFAARGRRTREVRINRAILSRDLGYFLATYSLAVLVGIFDPGSTMKALVALLLLVGYGLYVYRTMRAKGDLEGETRSLYFHYTAGAPDFRRILLQLLVALSAIIFGAELFVGELTVLAEGLGVPALVISLLLTPVATELPEKFNSVFWMRERKDTLAMGNITGAMVFQSAIPVSVGLLFTEWDLDNSALLAAGLALLSGSFLWLRIRATGTLGVNSLLFGGVFYAVFLTITLISVL